MQTPVKPRQVTACFLEHRGQMNIALKFTPDPEIQAHLQKLEGIKWTQTHQCYYLEHTKENIARLLNHCRGVVWVDITGLRKRQNTHTSDHPGENEKKCPLWLEQSAFRETCLSLIQQVEDKIRLKGYSQSTLKNYTQHLRQYLGTIADLHDPREMTKSDIEQYLLERQQIHPTSESEINSHINAIKFLYEQVLMHDRMLFYLPRPEKPLQLPKVLGEHELERLFRSVVNLKHKAILLTAFSCGLRVSEVVKLRIRDIDSERMQIFIERAKGKKDRYVTLSPILLDVLRQYVKMHRPRPKDYLFEGQTEGQPYSARSAQTIFKRAVDAAGIRKKVSFHTLRHSYATHLLEKGVDIKYIKELLGHFDIKTTERYLHVAKDKLVQIKSPLDFLDI